MKKLFEIADEYIRTSDWKTISVLKFCLLSIGILVGMQIRAEHKPAVRSAALSVFVVTYIPLMAKLFRIAKEQQDQVI